ncbi:MAG: signal recognition particle-docking protein FtsY [Neisseria sp.]|nr:signal recognition particle-docking protein FtsY [Neisseria sp.]
MFSFFKRKKQPQPVETVKETVQEAAQVLEQAADAAAERAEEVKEAAVQAAEQVADGLESSAEQAVEKAENAFAEAVQQAESAAEKAAETLTAAADLAENLGERPSENGQDVPGSQQADGAEETADIASPAPVQTVQPETESLGWAARLKKGLTKSRNHMAKSLAGVFGGGKIDEDLYEELETVLLTSDMGIEATEHLMDEVRKRVSLRGLKDGAELRSALKEAVYEMLKPLEKPLAIPDNGQPFVIMMAGINGAGKTTSIGKLAKYFQQQGKSVVLAAGDTFRAAAREQLQEWGARNGVTVISQVKGDSAAVCFDAVEAAKARKIDIVLADTAGRLPTQLHLMEEIKKVKRVLQKAMPDAPHEIIVVLDANIGQNAVNQVIAFDDALGVTGLIVTKLDGTAKGGVLAALASARPIPVRYIGVGESIDDLRPFDARAFVDALLDEAV